MFIFLLLLVVSAACVKKESGALDTYVVMVSFDGFRWDYTDLYDTPNLDEMTRNGVRAERLIPSFPTKTFPNHYTLATGLYPDHHGIINNVFYAYDLDRLYRIGDREMVQNASAYFGEPIWVTAEKQGVRSASYFWVGSEAPVKDTYPSFWKKYDGQIPYANRVDQVIRWLKMPSDRGPGLILLYFDEPDGTGHDFGPGHPETGEVVTFMDSILGYLRSEIAKLDWGDRINLVVVSDHGMGPVSGERYVNLNDHLKEGWAAHMTGSNPVYLIEPAEGFADSITETLNAVRGLRAWQADGIPPHLHYGTSSRFPGILVVADSLWSVGTEEGLPEYAAGAHGYDTDYTAMHTIFLAEGPAFRKQYTRAPFSNVEVYNILARILDLDPAPNDGDIRNVEDLFATPESE